MNSLTDRIDRYIGFLDEDQDNPALLGDLVHLLIEAGRPEDARHWLGKAVSQYPEDRSFTGLQGLLELAEGNYIAAISSFQSLLDQGVEHESIRYNLAYAHIALHRGDDALTALLPLENIPVQPATQLLLGRCFHQCGEFDRAREQLSPLAENPDYKAEALGMISQTYLDQENLVQAREAAQSALKVNPGNLQAKVTLSYVDLMDAHLDSARAGFEQVINTNAVSGRAWSGLGMASMLAFDLEAAIQQLTKATEYMPTHLGAWNARAWAELMAGQLDEAEQSLSVALEMEPRFAETQGALAVIAAQKGNWDRASRLAKLAVRLDPESFAGQLAISLVQQNNGNAGQAQLQIEKIYQQKIGSDGQNLGDQVKHFLKDR